MQRIFVETTIQVQRLLGEVATVNNINNILNAHQTVTSNYVWMEVHCTIGQDYHYLINLLLSKRPTTISQLMRHLGAGESIYSPRRLKRMLQIMAQWLEQVETSTIAPIEAAYQLKRQSNRLLYKSFFDDIDEVVDQTKCDLIQPEYKIQDDGRISCSRKSARCSLHDMLYAKRERFQKVHTNSDLHQALGHNTQRAISDIGDDYSKAKGERNCWALGDLIIALECPNDAAIWTTNTRHFEPICSAIGKQLFYPDNR